MEKYPMSEFRKKSQVTIPKEIVDEFNLEEGDKLEFIPEKDGIKIRPVVTIPKSQLFFWTQKWQKGEKEADEDIKAGRVSGPYQDIDKLEEDLEK
jgi:AbrB family looped-hinge helix DNA binding protein